MKITIDDSARSLGVDKAYVVLCQGVSPGSNHGAALESAIREVEHDIKTGSQEPSVFETSFRNMFVHMGYPGTVPAGAKLRNRIASTGFKRLSSIIDAYNLVAARYAYGIGAHDAACIAQHPSAELSIRRAAATETIVPLFAQKRQTIPKGDLLYSFDGKTIAWLGKRDTDSDAFKITENTCAVFFVLLGREDIPVQMLHTVGHDLITYLRLCYPLLEVHTYCAGRVPTESGTVHDINL